MQIDMDADATCVGYMLYRALVIIYNYPFVSFSMNEEDMRLKLVSSSPLTTSVNAITWQDYIGTYVTLYM